METVQTTPRDGRSDCSSCRHAATGRVSLYFTVQLGRGGFDRGRKRSKLWDIYMWNRLAPRSNTGWKETDCYLSYERVDKQQQQRGMWDWLENIYCWRSRKKGEYKTNNRKDENVVIIIFFKKDVITFFMTVRCNVAWAPKRTKEQTDAMISANHSKTTVTMLPFLTYALTFIRQAHSSITTSHTGLAGAAATPGQGWQNKNRTVRDMSSALVEKRNSASPPITTQTIES